MVSALRENAAASEIGVALSATEIVVVDSRLGLIGQSWRMALETPAPDNLTWPSLTAALRTLQTLVRESRARFAIALLPPLSEVRKLELPPLPDDELELALVRNAARYFVGARGPQIASVASSSRNRAGQGVMAATTPVWAVRLITAAVRDAGAELVHLVPAEAAWAAAATETWPNARKGDATVLVNHTDRTDALQLADGALVNVRRVRSAVSEVSVFLESHHQASTLLALGDAVVRKEWMHALSTRGAHVSLPTALPSEVANDATSVAAAFAADADTMPFRTEDMRQQDKARRNRAFWSIVAASAALLIAAAGFSYWDVQRELVAVEAARAAIKPQLTTTMVGRTSVETVSGQLQILATTERENPHWSTIISELTESLPEDSYLTSLRGRADTVLFEGMATHAALVFPALQRVQSFSGVRAAAQVRREAGESGDALERFTLAARLRSAPAVEKPKPPAAPRASGTGGEP